MLALAPARSTVVDSDLILSEAKPSCQVVRGRGRAERAAKLCADAEHLAPADRTLVRWVYGDGRAIAHIAATVKRDPRSVGRRLERVVRRCDSPEFALVLAHASGWEEPLASIARGCVLEGRSVREVAAKVGMGVHEVRRLRTTVLAMARGVKLAGRTRK